MQNSQVSMFDLLGIQTNHKGEPYDYRIICVRKNGDATHSVCDYDDL